MQINPVNIINTLKQILALNNNVIQTFIDTYQTNRILNVYTGIQPSIPNTNFPALEIEPTDSDMEWASTETQLNTYNFNMQLTICSNAKSSLNLEYICGLTKIITSILNNPANMTYHINYEKTWNAQTQTLEQASIQFASATGVSYNSNSEGSIRVASWTYNCQVREGFERPWFSQRELSQVIDPYIEFPPKDEI